jgi:hypothetical protein
MSDSEEGQQSFLRRGTMPWRRHCVKDRNTGSCGMM